MPDQKIFFKIISGGRTGADQGALDAALELNHPCGGWRPKGRKSESGPIPDRYCISGQASAAHWKNPKAMAPWDYRHGGKRKSGFKDKDCSDFDTQAEAQRFFEKHQPGDAHNLDGNGDGEACDGLL